ncbi:MAG: hypothetical protein L0322_25850 [Chloroflexi bacterium]|nr:hypothetical protein [Chloroflexota bacterium]MCI0644263.1 hypothetical protein [Chloroflexota bacterium]
MLPAIVLPFHDPNGLYFPHLATITPQLKHTFGRAFLSISPATQQAQPTRIQQLPADPFFHLTFNQPGSQVGDHYHAAYHSAAIHSPAGQPLHLCDVDKIAFILQSAHREPFLADLHWANQQSRPVLFQRSPAAWATFPHHYRQIEHLAITLGRYLFGRYMDLAWSHLVIPAGRLRVLLPHLHSSDFGLLAEMILLLQGELITRDVDWLSWEDPFIYGRDAAELLAERDNDHEETLKRLRWLRPILQVLLESVRQKNSSNS